MDIGLNGMESNKTSVLLVPIEKPYMRIFRLLYVGREVFQSDYRVARGKRVGVDCEFVGAMDDFCRPYFVEKGQEGTHERGHRDEIRVEDVIIFQADARKNADGTRNAHVGGVDEYYCC